MQGIIHIQMNNVIVVLLIKFSKIFELYMYMYTAQGYNQHQSQHKL